MTNEKWPFSNEGVAHRTIEGEIPSSEITANEKEMAKELLDSLKEEGGLSSEEIKESLKSLEK